MVASLVALLALAPGATRPGVAQTGPKIVPGPQATISEYPLPTANSAPGGLVVGVDRAIWFAEPNSNRIGRIRMDGAITEYAIPTPKSSIPYQGFVGRGPDGAVWFTESLANKLGRMTPGGHSTEYSIPSAPTVQDPDLGMITTSFPIAIAAGPDHAVWFNERYGNNVGRMTLDGTFTEFPLPTPDSALVGLIAGPDGTLWFTMSGANAIGRITTDGTVTTYPVPTPKSLLLRLAVGPDRAIWFCEFAADKLGRITSDGAITEYALPADTGPVAITAGPDGALWFTGAKANVVGRLTPAGAVSTYAVPTEKSFPYHIVVGPDNALWFTESDGNKIGRLQLQQLPSRPLPHTGVAGRAVTFRETGLQPGRRLPRLLARERRPAGLWLADRRGAPDRRPGRPLARARPRRAPSQERRALHRPAAPPRRRGPAAAGPRLDHLREGSARRPALLRGHRPRDHDAGVLGVRVKPRAGARRAAGDKLREVAGAVRVSDLRGTAGAQRARRDRAGAVVRAGALRAASEHSGRRLRAAGAPGGGSPPRYLGFVK